MLSQLVDLKFVNNSWFSSDVITTIISKIFLISLYCFFHQLVFNCYLNLSGFVANQQGKKFVKFQLPRAKLKCKSDGVEYTFVFNKASAKKHANTLSLCDLFVNHWSKLIFHIHEEFHRSEVHACLSVKEVRGRCKTSGPLRRIFEEEILKVSERKRSSTSLYSMVSTYFLAFYIIEGNIFTKLPVPNSDTWTRLAFLVEALNVLWLLQRLQLTLEASTETNN